MADLIDLHELRLTRQVWVDASPAEVYNLISEVSAMTEWSPVLVRAHYDNGHGPWVGSWLTGRNTNGGHEWDTRMKVVSADPGVSFAWTVVSDESDIVTWSYTFRPENDGTAIEESWQVHKWIPPLGTTRDELLQLRTTTAQNMEATLKALAQSIAENRR